MLDTGIIEPSRSEWAFVHKTMGISAYAFDGQEPIYSLEVSVCPVSLAQVWQVIINCINYFAVYYLKYKVTLYSITFYNIVSLTAS